MNKTMPKCNRYRVLPASGNSADVASAVFGGHQVDRHTLYLGSYAFNLLVIVKKSSVRAFAGVGSF